MNRVLSCLAMIAVLSFSFSATAQEQKCPVSDAKGAQCPIVAQGDTALADKPACCEQDAKAHAEILAKLPAMSYMVGTEKTCCPDSAAALAKKASQPIKFVVGEKTFEEKGVAFTALVESTEKYVSEFGKPLTCEKSGTVSVGGKQCGCAHEADALAKMVSATMDSVKMTFAIGDKECNCPDQAAVIAKESGKATEYVVNGKKTSCNLTARLNLAQAKYVAAVNALSAKEKSLKSPHGDQ